MRILVVSECIREDREGGDCTFVTDLCRQWGIAGHSVHILTRRMHKQQMLHEDREHYKVTRFIAPSLGASSYFLYPVFSAAGALAKYKFLIRSCRPDIVHFHHPYSASAICMTYGMTGKTHPPFAFTFHSPKAAEYQVMLTRELAKRVVCPAVNALERFVLRRQDRVFTLSQFMKDQMIAYHGTSCAPISIIPGGVDTDRFIPSISKQEIRSDLHIDPKQRMLLTVRRLVPRMGLERLLCAMPAIVAHHPDLLLVIVGDGPLRGRLEALTQQLDLQNHVKITGFVQDAVLPQYYQAADLFVLPTAKLEGYGLVILEAFSSGLPVLGTPVGAIPAILSEFGDDLVFPSIESEDMACKIVEFLDTADFSIRGRNYRERVVSNHSWARVAERYISAFEEMAASASAAIQC